MKINRSPWAHKALLFFGILLVLGGVIGNFFLVINFTSRTFALSLVVAGVLAINAARPHRLVGSNAHDSEISAGGRAVKKPGPIAWGLSGIWVVALVCSYLFLRDDVRHGGHVVWPVYAFAISGLGGGITWSYVMAKLMIKAGQ